MHNALLFINFSPFDARSWCYGKRKVRQNKANVLNFRLVTLAKWSCGSFYGGCVGKYRNASHIIFIIHARGMGRKRKQTCRYVIKQARGEVIKVEEGVWDFDLEINSNIKITIEFCRRVHEKHFKKSLALSFVRTTWKTPECAFESATLLYNNAGWMRERNFEMCFAKILRKQFKVYVGLGTTEYRLICMNYNRGV